MRRAAIFFVSILLFVATKAALSEQEQDSNYSLMDRARRAVEEATEKLTSEYNRNVQSLAAIYRQSGDLGATAAADAQLSPLREFGTQSGPRSNTAGLEALRQDYARRLREETIRALRPLIVKQRDEIAKRKLEGDVAIALIMEKEVDAVRQRFNWKTETLALNNAKIPAHPAPVYPLQARQKHLTGRGSFILEIDTITGAVTHVIVSKSTGHRLLDDAAISAFSHWKFQRHATIEVEIPVTFSMNSAKDSSGKR